MATIKTTTTYLELLRYVSTFKLGEDQLEAVFERAKETAVPDWMRTDWNALEFGKLCALQRITTASDMMLQAPIIVLADAKLSGKAKAKNEAKLNKKLMTARCLGPLAFISDAKAQMERIAKLFKKIEYKPTSEEHQAGIDSVEGSMHNLADWYARRMAIADINDVYMTPWVIIYRALKIDRQNEQFQRRLNHVLNKRRR